MKEHAQFRHQCQQLAQKSVPQTQSTHSLGSDASMATQLVKHAIAFQEHNLNSTTTGAQAQRVQKNNKSHQTSGASLTPQISVLKHYRDQIYENQQQPTQQQQIIGGHLVPSASQMNLNDFKMYQTPQRTDSQYHNHNGGVSAQAKTDQMMKHYEEPLASK